MTPIAQRRCFMISFKISSFLDDVNRDQDLKLIAGAIPLLLIIQTHPL